MNNNNKIKELLDNINDKYKELDNTLLTVYGANTSVNSKIDKKEYV